MSLRIAPRAIIADYKHTSRILLYRMLTTYCMHVCMHAFIDALWQEMFALMAEGGHVFWVAPSGGRDRPDEEGRFAVAPFDFKNLDTFKIISMQARKVCSHLYVSIAVN